LDEELLLSSLGAFAFSDSQDPKRNGWLYITPKPLLRPAPN
jgi:hypothetical protein